MMKHTCSHFVFGASGVVSALVVNYLQLHGVHDPFLLALPMFVGPLFTAALMFTPSDERRYDWRYWIALTCDIAGLMCVITSIDLAGSSIWYLTYSWVTVLAAALKRVIMGQDQTRYQVCDYIDAIVRYMH
jgi:drug/metabolite transporter (DMT)-like permease